MFLRPLGRSSSGAPARRIVSVIACSITFVSAAGCGTVGAEPSPAEPDAGGATARTTGDGAPGVCCAPSIGGCASVGGYRADGSCDSSTVCDNMCEQRIVDDEHGCKKLVYKRPPVMTAYAGPESCDSPRFNGGRSAQDPPAKPANPCKEPTVLNDPACPKSFARELAGKSCPRIGLECSYPGVGDETSNGCYAAGLMACWGEAGPVSGDAGPDAGSGTWTLAQ